MVRRRESSSHNPHGGAAALTKERRARLDPGRGRSGNPLQHEVQQRDQAFAVGMQKAEVACAPEALG